MRKLTDHKVNGLNELLEIFALDEPGDGVANHRYTIELDAPSGSSADEFVVSPERWDIDFHKGPIQEDGYNGLSNEALIAIVIDRMRGFQSGKFACRENALALTKLEEALMWLQKRTRDRVARGVEGTHNK